MSAEGDATFADKAFDAAGKAARGVASGFKKATNVAADKISATSGSTLLKIMRYGDIALGVALILTYPIDIFTKTIKMDTTTFFMMAYCIVFSALLIYFEVGLGTYEETIRKYFGFMFSYMGRTVFTLFAVAMVFSKGGSESYPIMNVIVGIVGVCLCVFNFFVVCKHPDFQKGGALYDDGEDQSGPAPAPSKKATPAAKPAASYEANPFEDSDDDIPSASVPGSKSAPKPSKKSPKKSPKKREENPFEDDNPFDD